MFPAFVHTHPPLFPAFPFVFSLSSGEVCMFPGYRAHFPQLFPAFPSVSALSSGEVCMFSGLRAHFPPQGFPLILAELFRGNSSAPMPIGPILLVVPTVFLGSPPPSPSSPSPPSPPPSPPPPSSSPLYKKLPPCAKQSGLHTAVTFLKVF